jgi:hypothetical protein
MPVAGGRPSARDLLSRVETLRAAIDWRKHSLFTNDPHVDRVQTAVQLATMERDLARTEHLIIARARAITLEIKRAAKEDELHRTFHKEESVHAPQR